VVDRRTPDHPSLTASPGAAVVARARQPPPPRPAPVGPRLSDVDSWGRSESQRRRIRALTDPFYRHWFRTDWEGLEKIPTEGGALLVANHAGAVPSDAPMIMHGIETELRRPVYGLADFFFRSAPFLGTLWARGGGVAAHPENALRLLRDDRQLALVFPEGTKATGKVFGERYRLRRFGRGGFVETAMRAGVPVIPIAVLGSEEAMPTVATFPRLARMLRVPYLPLTANMMVFGPLGVVLPFPVKLRFRVLDPVYFDVPAGEERYSSARILAEAEEIRGQMQETLYDMLRERHSVWRG
jgi:1-acyl-sn-glycerol-3-phosphate acyltransferase